MNEDKNFSGLVECHAQQLSQELSRELSRRRELVARQLLDCGFTLDEMVVEYHNQSPGHDVWSVRITPEWCQEPIVGRVS